MSLGDTIRITRQKALFTQKDFAHKLNVALSTVNRWELNKVRPNMKAMKSITYLPTQKRIFAQLKELLPLCDRLK